jgi:1,4-alpha-glucan branching enzyme
MNQNFTRVALLFFAMLTQFSSNAFNVTFRVDMSQQSGFTTPEVNGSFNNWCGNCFQMTDADGDNIWEATTDLAPGNYEYKFSADGWGSQENLIPGSACTVTNFGFTNRSLVVTQETILPIVCWGACVECAAAPVFYDVTFQVDMNEQTGFTTPEVNGIFNGWCGNCTAMQDANGDGIWSVTVSLQAGTYEYKFSHDNWAGQESLTPGSSCTITTDAFTNRTITVSQDEVLPAVCYGSCAACGVNTGPFDVTFSLDMNNVDFPFTTPEVNGTFNNWCGSCAPLSDTDGDNVWTITIPLQAASYEYKFSYDNWSGQEMLVTGSSCTQTSPEGFVNRAVTVEGVTDLGVVCWESCNACNVVVLNQMNLPVTFDDAQVEYGLLGFDGSEDAAVVVDPTNAANMVARVTKSAAAGASSGVTITAPAELGFSSPIPFTADATTMSVRVWSPDAGIQVRLKVEDHNDPTHSIETNVNTSVANDWEVLVFDFSNQSAGTAALNLGYSYDKASIFFNFGVDGATAGEKTYYFDDVVFGGEVIVATQYNVTFQVDMQNVSGFTTPEVNGSFNGWCGGCFALTDDNGDGIWTGTAAIEEGIHEFKFAYDAWTGQENLLPGLPCTVTNFGFTNRSLNVTGDVVLPVVCWESCGDCSVAPITHEVTFQVDMNGVVGFTTPEVNGTFNNWCGSCFQMSDVNGDGIWVATTTLQEGSYEFKYSYDNWTGSEQLTSGDPCTVTNGNFVNRSLNLQSDTILAPVCWALCGPCTMPEPVSVTLNLDLGDAVATSAEVTGSFNNFCVGCQPMTSLGNNQYSLTFDVMPGVHYYQFTINGGTQLENLAEGTCTVAFKFGVARELVASDDVNVGMVCWESCAPCLVNVDEVNPIQFVVSPNPVNALCSIQFNQGSMATYQILDSMGRVVLTGATNGAKQITLTTDQLPAGLYQIVAEGGSHQFSQKIIVQH